MVKKTKNVDKLLSRMSAAVQKNIKNIPSRSLIQDAIPNIGNISEGIFAAAICARFFTRKKRLAVSDVINIINQLSNPKIIPGKKSVFSELNLKAPNKNSKIKKDDLKLRIELSSVNMEYLKDYRNNSKELLPYVNSSIQYANSKIVMEWAKMVYENNRYDKIEVLAKGTTSGRTTKVDVETKITNDENELVVVDLVSLKAGDVKQFGQKGGVEFKNQKEFFENLFDISIDSLQTSYNTLIQNKQYVTAISEVYDKISTELSQNLSNQRTSKIVFDKLGDGIKYYATMKDENVKMVHLNLNEARLYDLGKLDELFSTFQYRVRYATYGKDGDNLPMLQLVEKITNKTLITIRCKKETSSKGKVYYRNYLEKEELFTEFLSRVI